MENFTGVWTFWFLICKDKNWFLSIFDILCILFGLVVFFFANDQSFCVMDNDITQKLILSLVKVICFGLFLCSFGLISKQHYFVLRQGWKKTKGLFYTVSLFGRGLLGEAFFQRPFCRGLFAEAFLMEAFLKRPF